MDFCTGEKVKRAGLLSSMAGIGVNKEKSTYSPRCMRASKGMEHHVSPRT